MTSGPSATSADARAAVVTVGDGTRAGAGAGAGDIVITRANDRRLPITATEWVKNGDRWTVTAVRDDGALTVTHRATHCRIVLPPGYVAAHVTLGYATTVHAAQGVTADVAHTVAADTETRQVLYVAMTRGRHANHLYLTTTADGDEHTVTTREAPLPPTAVDVLTRILARDGAQVSATSTARTLTDPTLRLQEAVDRYRDAVATAAQHHLGPDRLARIDAAADALVPAATDQPAWPTLRVDLTINGSLHGLTAVTTPDLGTRTGGGFQRDPNHPRSSTTTWPDSSPQDSWPAPWLHPDRHRAAHRSPAVHRRRRLGRP